MRVLLALLLLLAPAVAVAAPRKDFPCKGCLLEPRETRAPLLVVLHGDGQSAAAMAPAWSAPAAARSVTLLFAECPRDLGCKGSFWSWNGEPKWLDGLVDAVSAEYAIDPDRVWLAGWSGGASYLGLRAFELSDRFAAMTIDGGGLAPGGPCPKRVLPTYFLVGDKNPYHSYAIELRDAQARCGGEVLWDLRKGQGHPGEWAALTKSADAILAWLEGHPKPVVAAAAAPSVALPPAAAPAVAPAAAREPAPEPAAVRLPPAHHCGCATPGASHATSAWLVVLLTTFSMNLRCSRRARV